MTVTGRLTSVQEFSLVYDKIIVHPPSPPPPLVTHTPSYTRMHTHAQVMRECSEGCRVAVTGPPQDLLADPSSVCVGVWTALSGLV